MGYKFNLFPGLLDLAGISTSSADARYLKLDCSNDPLTVTLDNATGDEYALDIAYTTNKLISGDDYGLRITQTDTASPGTSYLIWAGVGTTRYFSVTNNGTAVLTSLSCSVLTAGNTNTIGAGGTTSIILGTDGSRDFTGAIKLWQVGPSTTGDGGSNSSGDKEFFVIEPTLNFTGAIKTGNVYISRVNPTLTSLPTGTTYLGWWGAANTAKMYIDKDGGLFLPAIKSGATQALAGAAANELWKTSGHATLPDNVVMIGV